MQHSVSSADSAQRLAVEVVRRHIPNHAYRLFLFGSRAKGTAHSTSDIDLGIEGPDAVPYSILAAIREELEEAPILYSVDVVDFSRVPTKFREIAQERLYLEPETV